MKKKVDILQYATEVAELMMKIYRFIMIIDY